MLDLLSNISKYGAYDVLKRTSREVLIFPMAKSKLNFALSLLSPPAAELLRSLPSAEKERINEIRLRRRRSLSVSINDTEYFISDTGMQLSHENVYRVTDDDMIYTYRSALKNSIHAFEREISEGYVTSDGGNRVGFCGRAVLNGKSIASIDDISSINIRIAREIDSCGDEFYRDLSLRDYPSLIIAGPPSSGKTTFLRSLCCKLSEKKRIALIDERNELAAVSAGVAYNNVGSRTDIFTSYTKRAAIMIAVRVMSPQFIVCDEIGGSDESEAFEYAICSGVKLIATCHASSFAELYERPVVSELIRRKAFDYAVILGTGRDRGQIIGKKVMREVPVSIC